MVLDDIQSKHLKETFQAAYASISQAKDLSDAAKDLLETEAELIAVEKKVLNKAFREWKTDYEKGKNDLDVVVILVDAAKKE